MRLGPGIPFCRCETCGDHYVLIEGHNNEKQCYWCSKGIKLQRRKADDEAK